MSLKVIRPELNPQIKALNPSDAERRSKIFKDNVSEFFKYLYAGMNGGEVLPNIFGTGELAHGDEHEKKNGKRYVYNPDIRRIENGRVIDTEVKVTSRRSTQLHCSVKQTSNNLAEYLWEGEKPGKNMLVEYGLFMYGHWTLMGMQRLSNRQLVKTLAEVEKKSIVMPINLLLFALSYATRERRDQTTSQISSGNQKYDVLEGPIISKLVKAKSIQDLIEGNRRISLLEDLCISDVRVEHTMSPKVRVEYKLHSHVVEPFPVVRYFIPENKQRKVVENIRKNYDDICESLRLESLYDKLPF